MKITVAGAGYVGLSIAVLLSQNNDVTAVDIVPEKVELLNSRKSPIADKYIEEYLAEKPLSLAATTDWRPAYASADIVVIATPTNYDAEKNYFDTSSVESVIEQVFTVNDHCTIVVKSTVPVGFTAGLHKKYRKTRTALSSRRSSSARVRRCTTTCIPPALSWERRRSGRIPWSVGTYSRSFSSRAR